MAEGSAAQWAPRGARAYTSPLRVLSLAALVAVAAVAAVTAVTAVTAAMPLRHQPPSLRKATMLVIASNFESICYGIHTTEDQHELMASDAYLDVEGPFAHMPSTVLEALLDAVCEMRVLNKKHLHILLQPQLDTLNLSFGMGDTLYGLKLVTQRCKKLKRLDISYLRHINPNILLGLVPRFSSLVSLNLRMTLTVDQMLASIGRNCPQLLELNLMATPITDRGLVLLCVGEEGQRLAQSLVRLVVAETFITAGGATIVLQSLPRLREFDFDQIFEVLERLEKWDAAMEKKLLHGVGVRLSEETAPPPASLLLTTLVSTAEQVRLAGLDAATRLCPDAASLTLANAWLASEDLYKFMLFEKLTSLSLTNSEGLTLDFHDGVLPLLVTCGPRLQNLIITSFTSVDIAGIGRSCKKLKNLAMSNIAQYESFGPICSDWFTELQALELWSDPQADLNPNMFRQLLLFSPHIKNLLFKGCEALTDKLFTEIMEGNPMKQLSHLTLDHCHAITGDFLHHLLDSENELAVVRLWSCMNITKYTNSELSRRICDENMDVYLEWFQYEE